MIEEVNKDTKKKKTALKFSMYNFSRELQNISETDK